MLVPNDLFYSFFSIIFISLFGLLRNSFVLCSSRCKSLAEVLAFVLSHYFFSSVRSKVYPTENRVLLSFNIFFCVFFSSKIWMLTNSWMKMKE